MNKLSELVEKADDDNGNDRDSIDSDSIEGTVDNSSNSKTGYDDEPTIEIDASKHPFLNKLDITVNSSNLYALLREREEHKGGNIRVIHGSGVKRKHL